MTPDQVFRMRYEQLGTLISRASRDQLIDLFFVCFWLMAFRWFIKSTVATISGCAS